VQALNQHEECPSIVILALPAAKPTLKAYGLNFIGFDDFLDPALDADAIKWGEELAAIHHSPTIGIPLKDSVAYLGLSYQDLVIRYGKEEAARLFKEKGRHAFLPLTVMERIFDRINPDFVVTTNSPRSEAAAIDVANQRGIGNLIMTDLFSGLGYYQMKAQHITFLNDFAQNMFIADGLVNPAISMLHITGNPAFDSLLAAPKPKEIGWIKTHFPACTDRPIVFHADNSGYWDCINRKSHIRSEQEIKDELEACYRAALASGAAYWVRPHPSQDRSFYERWLSGKEHAYLASAPALHDILRHCDVLIVRTTTVGLEACYMEKAVVQIDGNFHHDLPLAQMGIAFNSDGLSGLPATVKQALTENKELEKMRRRAKQVLPQEPASGKIASLILKYMDGQPIVDATQRSKRHAGSR